MARILYVATSDIHLHVFHRPYLRWLHEAGHEVDIAVERCAAYVFEGIGEYYALAFPRHLASREHWATLRRLRGIIRNGRYDLVHCHTPLPSALVRLAAHGQRRHGLKVLYTAHGFHFFRGAPWYYWATIFPAEYFLSRRTDGIVTINQDDCRYARDWLKCRRTYWIPGIGVDTVRFRPVSEVRKAELRHALGFTAEDFLLVYVSEFIRRKNHAFLLNAARALLERVPNARMVFLGAGELWAATRHGIEKMNLGNRVFCPGFREDVERFAAIADVGISSSRQEGLGLGLLEHMACGVPVVATEGRGHRELVEDGVSGFLFAQGDTGQFVDRVARLHKDTALRASMGAKSIARAQDFAVERSLAAMQRVYGEFLD